MRLTDFEPVRLDELAPATLASYKTKAGAAATAADAAGDVKTADKRFSGIVKATKKQFDQDAKGVSEDNLYGGRPDDEVKFFIDSEPAYYAVMDRFGDHIEFRGDDMVAPLRLWGAIQQTAGDAGGAADIAGLEDEPMWVGDELDEQGVAENYPKHQDLSGISTDKLKAYVAKYTSHPMSGEGAQVRRVRAELERRMKGVAEAKADPTGSWVVYNGSKVTRFKTHSGAKAYAEKNGGQVASSEYYHDKIQKQGVAEGSDRIAANKQDRLQALENKLKAKGYVKTKDSDGGEYQYRWTRDGAPSYVVNYRSGANGYAEFRKEQGVAEDDDAVAAFLARGGEIQQLKPQSGPKRSGVAFASKHIGSASGCGNTKGKVSGLGANTGKASKPVVTAEQHMAEDALAGMKRLAGIAPAQTQPTPGQRQYRHMPTAVQPR